MIVIERLRGIVRAIESTERNLATGRLDVLAAQPLVEQVRAGLGLAASDPRSLAIDKAIEQYRTDESKASLGLAAGSLLLLFVPGIGPALAAAAGAGGAALSWQQASIASAAANAGVRGGLISRGEATMAGFWAVLDTVLLGVDVATLLARAAKVLPHVAGAGSRALGRLSQARAAARSPRRPPPAAVRSRRC